MILSEISVCKVANHDAKNACCGNLKVKNDRKVCTSTRYYLLDVHDVYCRKNTTKNVFYLLQLVFNDKIKNTIVISIQNINHKILKFVYSNF